MVLLDPKLGESKTAASAIGVRRLAAIVAAAKVAPMFFFIAAMGLGDPLDSVKYYALCAVAEEKIVSAKMQADLEFESEKDA